MTNQFYDNLNDNKLGVIQDFEPDGSTLLIAFGGLRGRLAMPPFEFFSITSAFTIKRLFLRDTQQAWYQKGITSVSDNIFGVRDYICDILSTHPEITRTIFVGNSAGAYAALLFGHLTEANHVLAFSPQTYIAPHLKIRHLDYRWILENSLIYLSRQYNKTWDLKPILSDDNGLTQYHIHYCNTLRLDRIHAERLSDINRLNLHPYPFGGHSLVKNLKKRGDLDTILNNILASTS